METCPHCDRPFALRRRRCYACTGRQSERVTLECATCSEPFEVKQYRVGTSRFCSKACFDKNQAAESERTIAARFWARVDKSGPEILSGRGPCWLWTGGHDKKGYGYGTNSATHRGFAHRVAWSLTHGVPASGTVIRHDCDNPPCVRPDHLRIGTQADNIADKVARGRGAKGVTARHKLTVEQVVDIRARRAAGESPVTLGAEYGITRSQVWHIVTRKTWVHI